MDRAMNHYRRLAGSRRLQCIFEHVISRFVEAPIVNDCIVSFGKFRIMQGIEAVFHNKDYVRELAELRCQMRRELRIIMIADPDEEVGVVAGSAAGVEMIETFKAAQKAPTFRREKGMPLLLNFIQ
jgi:hypothetical protein